METIILNGKIGSVDTYDEAGTALGIIEEKIIKNFKGEEIKTIIGGYAIAPRMNKLCGYGKFACVNFYISDNLIDNPEKVKEEFIESMVGGAEASYSHMHTSLTGYVGTRSDFKVGNHDMIKILRNYYGKYIHLEIKIFKKEELPKELEDKIKENNK
jgi:hypothetical protein